MKFEKEVQQIQQQFDIVGRGEELALCLACLHARRNLMLEGPVGVGKSVLAEALAGYLARRLFRIDGDERYTEQKMTGWFDPALVLKGGYLKEYFIHGPLLDAMADGGILFVNEINRMPESVQNVLLPAMEERRLVIPQYGEAAADQRFQIVATQNPVEFVATSHLSEALVDRFEFVRLDYQSFDEECEIVRKRIRISDVPDLEQLIGHAVSLIRSTRSHPKVRRGASIRAAIGIVEIASRLGGLEGFEQGALAALTHRIEITEESGLSAEATVKELIKEVKKKPHSLT